MKGKVRAGAGSLSGALRPRTVRRTGGLCDRRCASVALWRHSVGHSKTTNDFRRDDSSLTSEMTPKPLSEQEFRVIPHGQVLFKSLTRIGHDETSH